MYVCFIPYPSKAIIYQSSIIINAQSNIRIPSSEGGLMKYKCVISSLQLKLTIDFLHLVMGRKSREWRGGKEGGVKDRR